MELVTAVSKRKLASIHVVGMEEFPFQNVLGKEVGKGLMKVGSSAQLHYGHLVLNGPIFSLSPP